MDQTQAFTSAESQQRLRPFFDDFQKILLQAITTDTITHELREGKSQLQSKRFSELYAFVPTLGGKSRCTYILDYLSEDSVMLQQSTEKLVWTLFECKQTLDALCWVFAVTHMIAVAPQFGGVLLQNPHFTLAMCHIFYLLRDLIAKDSLLADAISTRLDEIKSKLSPLTLDRLSIMITRRTVDAQQQQTKQRIIVYNVLKPEPMEARRLGDYVSAALFGMSKNVLNCEWSNTIPVGTSGHYISLSVFVANGPEFALLPVQSYLQGLDQIMFGEIEVLGPEKFLNQILESHARHSTPGTPAGVHSNELVEHLYQRLSDSVLFKDWPDPTFNGLDLRQTIAKVLAQIAENNNVPAIAITAVDQHQPAASTSATKTEISPPSANLSVNQVADPEVTPAEPNTKLETTSKLTADATLPTGSLEAQPSDFTALKKEGQSPSPAPSKSGEGVAGGDPSLKQKPANDVFYSGIYFQFFSWLRGLPQKRPSQCACIQLQNLEHACIKRCFFDGFRDRTVSQFGSDSTSTSQASKIIQNTAVSRQSLSTPAAATPVPMDTSSDTFR